MKKLIVALTLGLFVTTMQAQDLPLYPKVRIKTNRGDIVVELNTARAPITVYNFLEYLKKNQYDDTIFHRVIPGFMIQGGGYLVDYSEMPVGKPIPNESGNGLSNQPGTIAMARTNLPHTATSQFFINLDDNNRLDPTPSRWGYTVFGEVVEGMDVVEAIASIPTGSSGPFPTDAPQSMVIIKNISLIVQRPGSAAE
jgi:cyclophilin family peptidyl-prolyl cis-trans isomerase